MPVKLEFIKAGDDEWPTCPSCKKELREIKYKERGFFTSLTVFWCPYCRCLLGTSSTFNG